MHETEVIVVSTPAPVFVDSTGRRSRVLRRLAYGFGALCMLYGGLVSVSLAGGPVSSSAVLPLPDLHGGSDNQVAEERPAPTPAPTVTPAPRPMFATEALPRRPVSATSDLRPDRQRPAAGATRTSGPAPTRKTPSQSTAGATKPVESVTTPDVPPPTTTPAPPVETDPPADNAPPAPPPPAPGGTGGGTETTTGGTGTGGGSSGMGGGAADGRDEEPLAAPASDPATDPAGPPADGEGTDEVAA